MAAIERAVSLPFRSEATAARWLYTFGTLHRPGSERRPLTSWAFDRELDGYFQRHVRAGWKLWMRCGANPETPPQHKVYLSPWRVTDEWPEAILASFGASRPAAIKTAMKASTPGRPDKLIMYFDSPEERNAWLADFDLPDGPAHGVPFTEQVGASPALSIATDPFPHPPSPQSWRSMCAGIIAPLVTPTQQRHAAPEVCRQIAFRLQSLGIDAASWNRIETTQ